VPKSSPSTTAIYFIEQGEAEVLSEGGEATKVLGPGDAFGEISLVLTGQRTATVVARTPLGCSRSADRTSSASESACPSWNARYAASVSSGRRGSTRPEMIESERADEASPRELRLAGPVRGNVTRAWRIICDRDRLAGRGPRRCPLVTRGGRAGSPRPAIVSCRREDLRNALERRADERDARRGRHPHGNRQRSARVRAGLVGQKAGLVGGRRVRDLPPDGARRRPDRRAEALDHFGRAAMVCALREEHPNVLAVRVEAAVVREKRIEEDDVVVGLVSTRPGPLSASPRPAPRRGEPRTTHESEPTRKAYGSPKRAFGDAPPACGMARHAVSGSHGDGCRPCLSSRRKIVATGATPRSSRARGTP
jgi:hypothetical protein